MPTKILHILGGLAAGGTERYLLRLLRYRQVEARWPGLENHVAYNAGLDTLVGEFLKTGVRLLPYPGGNPARSFGFLPKLLKREHYDAVCCWTFPMFLPLLHARRGGVPTRIAFLRVRLGPESLIGRVRPLNGLITRGAAMAERLFLPRNATHLLSNSRSAIEELFPNGRGLGNIPTRVIRNGIDFPTDAAGSDPAALRRELGIPEGMKIVGHVAAFRAQKNHRLVVRIAETVCERHDDVCFAFFGEGTREGIPTLLHDTKYADRIRAFGYRNDLFDMLRLLDVFLLPSFSEGQSNALLEAMGRGVPFLVSAIPENLEIVPEAFRDCTLPTDDPKPYVERIEEMLRSPWNETRRESIRQAARSMADPERNFGEFLDFLASGFGDTVPGS